MKIMIVGLGVIGTTYAYAFQKAGFDTEHFIRVEKRQSCPKKISVKLLDGRENGKGKIIHDTYTVHQAHTGANYDLILLSVSGDKWRAAIKTLDDNRLYGPILMFNGISDTKRSVDAACKGRNYILGYPVAGGKMDIEKGELDCVLFDHVMLEHKNKANIDNYADITHLFHQSKIKLECPFDMQEWIWLHMAINAGVITTAASLASIKDTVSAARQLMNRTAGLSQAILTIRECIKIVQATGVTMSHYRNEIIPYKLPSKLGAFIMKRMFKTNQLTRRIMEIHANINDLLYVCKSVHDKGKELHVKTPYFDKYFQQMMQQIAEFENGK
ncbi:2-dehydropantoate 2-reductase [Sporolactobacillus shoreicorticis]|uniref:Ketopantoate reductase family protein n=1 Tax=Sporolactobacillus shoreicorticis TaxID=1923877 RepID=A0ABW5S3D1_9BACL|nr:2-dehydropantoate 2-reductase [Sporolactobacillus shoreicorticis]MCO7125877.1 2-dehydropantoate 2-reductase [Sporolactobacillus shoreicorticis]